MLTALGTVIAHPVAVSGSRTAVVIIPSGVTEDPAIGFILGIYATWSDRKTPKKFVEPIVAATDRIDLVEGDKHSSAECRKSTV